MDVVPSTNTDTHSFVSAVSNSITRGILRTGGNHSHTFAKARKNAVIAGGIYRHEFVSPSAYTVTDGAYNPTTGVMTLTIPNHGFESGDHIKMDDNSITFSCAFGGASGPAAQKSYPRSSDPISGEYVPIFNVTTNTFDIQVLDVVPSTNCLLYTSPSPRD